MRAGHREWNGEELTRDRRRADARALIGMGTTVGIEMQNAAHVISGDLKRSVHAAKIDTLGEVRASTANVQHAPDQFALEVGSWLPYACVEENRGGTHRFASLGYDLAKPTFDATMQRAYREEGM